MKFIPAIILFVCFNLSAQDKDTTSADTTFSINDTLYQSFADTLSVDTTSVLPGYEVDALYPLYQEPLHNESFFINRNTISFLDYRYAGNLFSPVGHSFLKDRGFIGEINELILYGTGNAGVFEDGILLNRSSDYFDLNNIQNEFVDSVEIISSVRGFLYGTEMNAVSVNFITRDFTTPQPYTRIKYYEGPSGEAFVDGTFNNLFFNRLNLSFDITNRKYDGLYDNSSFSQWLVKVRLKYFISNKINISGYYNLVSKQTDLNGGIDVDSIRQITNDVNSILFNPDFAPVVFSTRNRDTRLHIMGIRMLGRFADDSYTDINVYHHLNIERQFAAENNLMQDASLLKQNSGVQLKHKHTISFFALDITGNYEQRKLRRDEVNGTRVISEIKSDVFSVSPVLSSSFLNDMIIPSLFFKYISYGDSSYNGFGADIKIKLNQLLNLYAGFSRFQYPGTDETAAAAEAGINFNYQNLFLNLNLFSRRNYFIYYSLDPFTGSEDIAQLTNMSFNGLGFGLKYKLWKIGIETAGSYLKPVEDNVYNSVADYIKLRFSGGLYYIDILFNSNLNLKTGFVIKYYGPQYSGSKKIVNSAYQLDFTLAGKIQDDAIVYFSWENLFDKQYYLVPYYPMRERGIRFGLSWELFN